MDYYTEGVMDSKTREVEGAIEKKSVFYSFCCLIFILIFKFLLFFFP